MKSRLFTRLGKKAAPKLSVLRDGYRYVAVQLQESVGISK
jgi:hypothetical protein